MMDSPNNNCRILTVESEVIIPLQTDFVRGEVGSDILRKLIWRGIVVGFNFRSIDILCTLFGQLLLLTMNL